MGALLLSPHHSGPPFIQKTLLADRTKGGLFQHCFAFVNAFYVYIVPFGLSMLLPWKVEPLIL